MSHFRRRARRALTRVAAVVLALVLSITALGALFGSPATAAPPDTACLACPENSGPPTGTLFEAAEELETEQATEAAQRAERNQYVTGLEGPGVLNRDEDRSYLSFWDPNVEEGEIDLSEHKIRYSKDSTRFGIPSAETMMGALADMCFESYKTAIHVVNELVGWFVMGLVLLHTLMGPALDIAESIQTTVIGPFNLWQLVLAVLVVYMTVAYMRRRMDDAISQAAVTLPIVAMGAMLVPIDAIRWLVSLAAYSATALMVGGSGGDPTTIPGPSTGPINVEPSLAAWTAVQGNLEETLIAKPAELITFGAYLPAACQDAYAEGRAMRLPASDGRALDPLNAIEACQPYVEYAANPGSDRVVAAFVLVFLAWVYIIGVVAIALLPILGQIRVLGFTGFYHLILMGLAMPGGLASGAYAFVLKMLKGLMHVVIFGVAMLALYIAMNAMVEAGTDWGLFANLFATLSMPILMVIVYLTSASRQATAIKRAAARVRPPRERSYLERRGRWEAGHLLARGAHVAAATGYTGAALGLSKAKKVAPIIGKATKEGLVGTDEKRGLFYGPVKPKNGRTQGPPVNTRDPQQRAEQAPKTGHIPTPEADAEADARATEHSNAPAQTLAAYRKARHEQPNEAADRQEKPATAGQSKNDIEGAATTRQRGDQHAPGVTDPERIAEAASDYEHRNSVREAEAADAARTQQAHRANRTPKTTPRPEPTTQTGWSWDKATSDTQTKKRRGKTAQPATNNPTGRKTNKGKATPNKTATSTPKNNARKAPAKPKRTVAQGAVPQAVIYSSKTTARASRAIATGFVTAWRPTPASTPTKPSTTKNPTGK